MRVTKPGVRPPEITRHLICTQCDCEADTTGDEDWICPEPWCRGVMVEPPPRPVRTKARVLWERANKPGGAGCCNKYADNKACSCLEDASDT